MHDDNPYAAPEFSPQTYNKFSDQTFGPSEGGDCWQDRGVLVLKKGAILPDRCIKCNLPAAQYRLERKLSWHPPVWYLTLLISPLLYLIVLPFVRYTAKVEVGLCTEHRSRRVRAITYAWVTILGGFALMFGGPAWVDPEWLPTAVSSGLVIVLSGIIAGIVGAQVTSTKSIDEHHVWLAKVNPEYLKMLPAWLD